MKRAVKKVTLLLVLGMLGGSLSSCAYPNQLVIKASEDYYAATWPELKAYVMADPTLSPSDKQLRLETGARFRELMDSVRGLVGTGGAR